MADPNSKGGSQPPGPDSSGTSTSGEGSDTALRALIRKRRLQADAAELPVPPDLADQPPPPRPDPPALAPPRG